jgi:nitrogenase molybdenum-iron protein beta chain
MTKAMVNYFATPIETKTAKQINIIPGWVEPADIREIKALVRMFGFEPIVFPDTSGVMDAPQTGVYEMYPEGGVTVDELRRTGASTTTIALGPVCSGAAAKTLQDKTGVKSVVLPLPIGLRATDRLIMTLRALSGEKVPHEINRQRGRLLDLMTDMHQYFYGKTAGLWGDPDHLVSMSEMLLSLDMLPKFVVTGTPGKAFLRRMGDVLGPKSRDCQVRQGAQADMFLMHQWIKNDPKKVDLLIGNSYGKYIARDEDIPFIRHGLPVVDRVGHQYFPTVGYQGAIRMLEQFLSAFMDKQDRESPEESFELVM